MWIILELNKDMGSKPTTKHINIIGPYDNLNDAIREFKDKMQHLYDRGLDFSVIDDSVLLDVIETITTENYKNKRVVIDGSMYCCEIRKLGEKE